MPAPQSTQPTQIITTTSNLGHVNLMVDSFVATASVSDLRAVIRDTLGSGNPGFAAIFMAAARGHLRRTTPDVVVGPEKYFTKEDDRSPECTDAFQQAIIRARTLYGAGLGFDSLCILTKIVSGTHHLRWSEDDEFVNTLAMIDTDLSQAIQSSKEELDGGRVNDIHTARQILEDLRRTVTDSVKCVELWNGEFPFERTGLTLDCWKI